MQRCMRPCEAKALTEVLPADRALHQSIPSAMVAQARTISCKRWCGKCLRWQAATRSDGIRV
eukprot:13084862-Alexandrium_andersonii.AAC.1